MSKQPRYKVIHNPNSWFLPFEVWKAGKAEVEVMAGHKVVIPSFGKVKSFREEKAAEGYISYQKALRSFKEEE